MAHFKTYRKQAFSAFVGAYGRLGGGRRKQFDAALRETREELGVELDPEKGTLFTTAKRQCKEFPDFLDVWVFAHDCDIEKVTFQPGETCDAIWATSAQIKQLVENGEFVPQNVFPYLDKLFEVYG